MEQDVVDYLTDDPVLRDLLEGSLSNTKIYPRQAPQGADTPYILYDIVSDGTTEENLLERSLSFNCVAETELEAQQIRDQVVAMLDYQDQIRRKIVSTAYWFYWAKHTGGTNYKDPELDVYYHPVVISFKYAKITIEDITMIIKLVDKLGEWIDADNPLHVADRPTDSIREFSEILTVALGSWVTVLTHTVVDEILWVDSIIVTGSIDIEIEIVVDTITKMKYRTSEQDRTANFVFPIAQQFAVGSVIDIKVRHWNVVAGDFAATLIGHKYIE